MFDVNVPGTMTILTTDGNDRDDAIIALLNRFRSGPDLSTNHRTAVARKLVSIEQWSRTP